MLALGLGGRIEGAEREREWALTWPLLSLFQVGWSCNHSPPPCSALPCAGGLGAKGAQASGCPWSGHSAAEPQGASPHKVFMGEELEGTAGGLWLPSLLPIPQTEAHLCGGQTPEPWPGEGWGCVPLRVGGQGGERERWGRGAECEGGGGGETPMNASH